MNTARTPFGSIHDRLRQNIALQKAASSVEQTTGKEENISPPGSDAEVKDLLPAGGNPSGRGVNDLTGIGASAKEKLPGVNPNPPTEELERKEVSPDTKLAGIDPSLTALQERMAGNIKLAAEFFTANPDGITAPAEKTAGELTSLGEVQAPTDAALSSPNKADTSGAPVVVDGVTGVTQAEPAAGVASAEKQGPQEKAAAPLSQEDLDAIAVKTAAFTQDYAAGRSVAQAIMAKLAAPTPEEMDREKLAAAVENATMISTANALMGAGVERGVITSKQADDLMSMLGLRVNPLHTAIENVQQKLAELAQSPIGTMEQKIAFLSKIADEDPMAAAAAAGAPPPTGDPAAAAGGAPAEQPPVDPEQLRAAIGQLLQELQAAVQSGQMTEEQALGLLQELGIPLDAPGGDPAAAAPPEGGAPPPDAGGGGGGVPPGAGPPEGGAPPPGAAEEVPEKKDAPKEDKGEGEPDGDEGKKASIIAHNRAVFGLKLAAFLGNKKIAIDLNAPAIDLPSPQQLPTEPVGANMLPNYLPTAHGSASTPMAPQFDAKIDVSKAAPAAPTDVHVAPVAAAMHAAADPVGSARAAASGSPGSGVLAPSAPANATGAAPASGISWPHILGALGVGGLGALAYKGLSSDDEDERKRKHAEAVDPAMAAPPAPGGDPAAAGAPAGGGDPQQIIQELMTLLQSGQIKPEEGAQIIQELAASGQIPPEVAEQLLATIQGGAGGAPPPEAAAGAPPVA